MRFIHALRGTRRPGAREIATAGRGAVTAASFPLLRRFEVEGETWGGTAACGWACGDGLEESGWGR